MGLQFEDLNVWQFGKDLTIKVFSIFDNHKNYSFRDQIQRAAVSIMNNIAEGYDRETELDRKRFFVIAKGSCAEVRSMISLSLTLGYIDQETFDELNSQAISISKMLYALIKKIQESQNS